MCRRHRVDFGATFGKVVDLEFHGEDLLLCQLSFLVLVMFELGPPMLLVEIKAAVSAS